jgi:uncharacterized protein YecE (DUF72 family)
MVSWYLGTMGFSYKEWQGPFYPAGMPARDYLAHYSQFFNAVEIDSSFYGTPRPDYVERWAAVTPPPFTFCPKTPRAITHDSHLPHAVEAMEAFVGTVALLGEKLGAILLQFPPDFTYAKFNPLMTFLKQLPPGRRYAVEFRHRSWDTPGTAALLEQHNICWVTADYIYMPKKIQRTADFLYLRFLGRRGQFPSADREHVDKTPQLQKWWRQLQNHLDSVDTVYGFINDDYAGYAPATVNKFKKVIGLETKDGHPPQQGRLF